MHILGSHEVARRLSPDKAYSFRLGAMVPQILHLARLTPTISRARNDDVQAGLNLYFRAAAIFEDTVPVQELKAQMSESLADFMPQTTAEQCARVEADLLVDGVLMEDPDAVTSCKDTLVEAMSGGIDLGGLAAHAPELGLHLSLLVDMGLPNYADPKVTAKSVFRTLSSRPQPLDAEAISHLEELTPQYQARAARIVPQVLDIVVEQLADA